jgi:hypothetical protein
MVERGGAAEAAPPAEAAGAEKEGAAAETGAAAPVDGPAQTLAAAEAVARAGDGETPRAAPPPSPEPQTAEHAESALPAGAIAKAVVVGRLRDPKTVAALAVVIAVLAFLLGRRTAR